jgi:hypothetical protein
MTTPPPPCSMQISLETLSALRDDALEATDARRLHAHIPTCAACQARLAGFARVAHTLHIQRDLEPDPLFWRSLQPQLATRRASGPPRRTTLLSGAAATVVVLAMALVFAQVVRMQPGVASTHSSTTAVATTTTASQSPTSHPKPTPLPTATPINFAGLPGPTQVWGPTAALASFTLNGFIVGGITPDGTRLLGYRLAADKQNYDVGYLDIATQQFTTFDESPVRGPTTKLNNPPTCCISDGRFYVGGNGVTVGASTTAGFYYDTQTGQLHTINAAEAFPFGVHAGVIYGVGLTNGKQGLQTLNMVTGVAGSVTALSSAMNYYAFSWPDLVYATSTNGSNQILHVYDLQTGADAAQAPLGDVSMSFIGAALDGDTLFVALSASGLLEIDHSLMPTNVGAPLTSIPGNVEYLPGANARLVVITTQDFSCTTGQTGATCTYILAWDRVDRKLMLLSPSKQGSSFLNGTFLAVMDAVANSVTIYNTATLP